MTRRLRLSLLRAPGVLVRCHGLMFLPGGDRPFAPHVGGNAGGVDLNEAGGS